MYNFHSRLVLKLFVLVLANTQLSSCEFFFGTEEQKKTGLEKFALSDHGELVLKTVNQWSGKPMGPMYNKRPVLLYNGKIVESEYPIKNYSNQYSFTNNPNLLKKMTYKDYRDFSTFTYKHNSFLPDQIYKGWYIYVDPDEFSVKDFENIIILYEKYEKEINNTLKSLTKGKYHKIGVITYSKEGKIEMFDGVFSIAVYPNGNWLHKTERSIGGPSGYIYYDKGKGVMRIPAIPEKSLIGRLMANRAYDPNDAMYYKKHTRPLFPTPEQREETYKKYLKENKHMNPYDPHFLRFNKNTQGQSFEQLYRIEKIGNKNSKLYREKSRYRKNID